MLMYYRRIKFFCPSSHPWTNATVSETGGECALRYVPSIVKVVRILIADCSRAATHSLCIDARVQHDYVCHVPDDISKGVRYMVYSLHVCACFSYV